MGTSSSMEIPNPSLSNNSLTVLVENTTTTDAMEDLWTTLSNTLRKTHSSSNPTTDTLLKMENAKLSNPRKLLPLLDSRMLLILLLNFRLHSTNLLSQLPSKPIKEPSNLTNQVSLPQDVELNLIMVSSPLVTEHLEVSHTSLSRTHGVQAGEIKVTLESDKTTFVVSSTLPHIHMSDQTKACSSSCINFNFTFKTKVNYKL